MSSELFSLNPAATTDRPVGFGIPTNTQAKTASPDEAKKNTATPNNPITKVQDAREIKEAKKLQDAQEASEENKEVGTLSASELRETLDEINSALYSYNRSLRFELYEETDDLVVKVFNTKTDEVIRQYPSEEVLERKAKLLEGDTNFFSTKVS